MLTLSLDQDFTWQVIWKTLFISAETIASQKNKPLL